MISANVSINWSTSWENTIKYTSQYCTTQYTKHITVQLSSWLWIKSVQVINFAALTHFLRSRHFTYSTRRRWGRTSGDRQRSVNIWIRLRSTKRTVAQDQRCVKISDEFWMPQNVISQFLWSPLQDECFVQRSLTIPDLRMRMRKVSRFFRCFDLAWRNKTSKVSGKIVIRIPMSERKLKLKKRNR